MAEYGAHITIISQDQPSIFDVVAQETLLEGLQPAFKHLLKVLAEKNPSKFGKCFLYADEIFFCLHTLLQFHYLSNYGASFAENFYDLKRVPLNEKLELPKPLSLHRGLLVKSLLALTITPYARHALNKYLHTIEEERARGPHSQKKLKEKLKSIFIALWPKIHLIIQLTTLVYYIRYLTLTRKRKVHSPLLHLSGVFLSRLTEQDEEYIDKRSNRLSYGNIRSLKEFGWWVVELVGWGLQNSLEIGAFFLQFLDWFYSSNSSNKLFASSPIPPPPHKRETSESDSQLDVTKCPICLKKRRQETVLAVSGYVFCYSCILLHLRKTGTCPVTQYPATTKQLIRIYKE